MTYQKPARHTSTAGQDAHLRQRLSALGDPTRQAIVEKLRRGPRSVGELSASLPVSRPAVSQHLKVLKSAGIVTETRAGVRHYFALDATGVDALRCHFEALWQDVLLEFSNYVKESERARKTR